MSSGRSVLTFSYIYSKFVPIYAWTGLEGSRRLRFQDNRNLKLVSFQALHTGHLYPQEILAPLGIEPATFRFLAPPCASLDTNVVYRTFALADTPQA